MEQTLQLVFRNEAGTTFNLSLAGPRADLTTPEVVAAMDLVIDRNVFQSTGGTLTGKVRAVIIARDVEEIATFE